MHDVILNEKILARNAELAAGNRRRLREKGIYTLNLISSPGSGKTSIIEKTLEKLDGKKSIAVIEGDIQADLDVQRLSRFNIPLKQINTGRSCHLDAHMIRHTLPWLIEQDELDILIIENVGNMVCPAEFDLGEDIKVSVMSVSEGDDKPLKYPAMFHASDVLLINKLDLAPYCNFDLEKAKANALKMNPDLKILEISCTTGEGINDWVDLLEKSADN